MSESILVAAGSAAIKSIWHALQGSIRVEIQNRCSNLELTSPVYFCDNAKCDMPLEKNVDSNNTVKAKFWCNPSQIMFQGGIMYEVKATSTPSNETGANDTTTETNENTSIGVQLLVAWKIGRIGDPCLFTILLEHDSSLTWKEKRLRQLIEEHSNRFKVMSGKERITWLMLNGTVLKTELSITNRRPYKLITTISKGDKDKYTTNPIPYEPKL
jgi:hypothetical protein